MKWQLTVRKTWKFEINHSDFQRFALRFIDYYRKSEKSSGELNSLELEWKISLEQSEFVDKDFISFEFSFDDRRLNHIVHHFLDGQTRTGA
jgi:hypothetical protein